MGNKSLFLVLLLAGIGYADTGFRDTVRVTETDGSPSCMAGQLKFQPGQVTCSGQTATMNIVGGSGGASSLGVYGEGVLKTSPTVAINFKGSGVAVTVDGSTSIVTITGGGVSLPLPAGATNYIQNRDTLQAGATFYVSSGTVAEQLNISSYVFVNGLGIYNPPPSYTLNPDFTIVTQFQSGHGFTKGASGTQTDDGTDFVQGIQSLALTTDGAGTLMTTSKTSISPTIDFTGKQIALWVKTSDLSKMAEGSLYLSSDNLSANFYVFDWSAATSGQTYRYIQSGEWTKIYLNWGDATVTGSPNRAAINSIRFRVKDTGAGAVTVKLNGLAMFNEPAKGMVSITFDDGYKTNISTAARYMDAYGFRGTAYVIPANIDSTSGFMTMDDLHKLETHHGWEISAHHQTDLTSLGDEDVKKAQLDVKNYLLKNGFTKASEGIAYPNGAFDTRVSSITKQYFSNARTIVVGPSATTPHLETFPPAEPMKLRSIVVNRNYTNNQLWGYVNRAATNKEWLILTFHDIVQDASGDSGNTQYSVSSFTVLMATIAASNVNVRPIHEALTDQSQYVRLDMNTQFGAIATSTSALVAQDGLIATSTNTLNTRIDNKITSLSTGTVGTLSYQVSLSTGVMGSLYQVSLSTGITGTLGYKVSLSTGVMAELPYKVSASSGLMENLWKISLSTGVMGTLPVANGGTNLTASADDNTIVGNGTTWETKAIPSCSNATTSKLLYDTASNSFSCGTDQTSAGGGYATIDDENVALTQRTVLNFAGAGVTCADDTTQTTCTIPGGSGGELTYQVSLSTGVMSVLPYQVSQSTGVTGEFNHQVSLSSGIVGDFGRSVIANYAIYASSMIVSSNTILPGATFYAGNGGVSISTLTINGPLYRPGFRIVTSTITLGEADGVVLSSAGAGATWNKYITITLPPANAKAGQMLQIMKVDYSSSAVRVITQGTDLIISTKTVVLNAPGQVLDLMSDGVKTWIPTDGMPYQHARLGYIEEPNTAVAVATSSNTHYCPITVTEPVWATGIRYDVGATGSAKIDVGIVDIYGTKLASSGATSIAGTGLRTTDFTAGVGLLPGVYYYAITLSNTTATLTRFGTGGSNLGCAVETGSTGTIPTTANLTGVGAGVRQYSAEIMTVGGGAL